MHAQETFVVFARLQQLPCCANTRKGEVTTLQRTGSELMFILHSIQQRKKVDKQEYTPDFRPRTPCWRGSAAFECWSLLAPIRVMLPATGKALGTLSAA